jgi:hypothetical protein
MTQFVYSTLTCDQRYTLWVKGGADLPVEAGFVLVKGGSNVADGRLITPIGVRTEISDEEYALLLDSEVFKLHVDNGFVTVEEKKVDPEVVAADLNTRDASAPITDADAEAQAADAAATGQASVVVSTNKNRG